MTREALVALLRDADPLAAAKLVPAGDDVVTWTRSPAPEDWLVETDAELPLDEHRAAHREGRASEAVVTYGAGTSPEAIADRLLALGELARETGLLRAVCPVPAEGGSDRPGSWGVEDLTVIAAARLACPDGTWVRPDWKRLGSGACQVATAFGANDWRVPESEKADPNLLASAAGRTAVER
jgi:2-iminoacetate synthase ThiH